MTMPSDTSKNGVRTRLCDLDATLSREDRDGSIGGVQLDGMDFDGFGQYILRMTKDDRTFENPNPGELLQYRK